eukprot:TRINITY_DN66778_c0_g4_i5.p1 TRINITY_DN66778_c0_g4~~TRINITY_DN66778_c0_g4_i5.p1  ORF type:complete len:125 (-),score=5.65 TRINITY_DN66778_c0_g4_i5:361-735(-)
MRHKIARIAYNSAKRVAEVAVAKKQQVADNKRRNLSHMLDDLEEATVQAAQVEPLMEACEALGREIQSSLARRQQLTTTTMQQDGALAKGQFAYSFRTTYNKDLPAVLPKPCRCALMRGCRGGR